MANDKIHQTKKKLARRTASLQKQKRILIVCEGTKTEPLYLEELISYLHLKNFAVQPSDRGSDPKSVVKYGESIYKGDRNFEYVFFVFDRDSHSTYGEALKRVEELPNIHKNKTKFSAITSVPCFEIWFILHFEAHTKPYTKGGGKSPCENLISYLKTKDGFEDYAKNSKEYFDLLKPLLDNAKKNAANTLEQSGSAGAETHYGNPTTLIHKLINVLENVANTQKK